MYEDYSMFICQLIDDVIKGGIVTDKNMDKCCELERGITTMSDERSKQKCLKYVSEKYPDDKYWGCYIRGALASNSKLVLISANLNNPLAQFLYSWKHRDVDDISADKFYDNAVNAGHPDAIDGYLETLADDFVEEKLDYTLNELQKIEHFAVKQGNYRRLGELYHKIFISLGGMDNWGVTKQYAENALEYFLNHNDEDGFELDPIYTQMLYVKAKEQKQQINNLKRLKNMTLDTVCKSVVTEYI